MLPAAGTGTPGVYLCQFLITAFMQAGIQGGCVLSPMPEHGETATLEDFLPAYAVV